MRKAWMVGAAALATATACTPQEVAWWADHPEHWNLLDTEASAPLVQRPACEGMFVWSYATDDPGQTTLDCDLTPPQVWIVTYDEVSWGDHETWGSDASLAWAEAECADRSGEMRWLTPTWGECWNASY